MGRRAASPTEWTRSLDSSRSADALKMITPPDPASRGGHDERTRRHTVRTRGPCTGFCNGHQRCPPPPDMTFDTCSSQDPSVQWPHEHPTSNPENPIPMGAMAARCLVALEAHATRGQTTGRVAFPLGQSFLNAFAAAAVSSASRSSLIFPFSAISNPA